MMCELIGGFNPFTSQNIMQTFENILAINVNWPKNISKTWLKLLQGVFVADPNLRMTIYELMRDPLLRNREIKDALLAGLIEQIG